MRIFSHRSFPRPDDCSLPQRHRAPSPPLRAARPRRRRRPVRRTSPRRTPPPCPAHPPSLEHHAKKAQGVADVDRTLERHAVAGPVPGLGLGSFAPARPNVAQSRQRRGQRLPEIRVAQLDHDVFVVRAFPPSSPPRLLVRRLFASSAPGGASTLNESKSTPRVDGE